MSDGANFAFLALMLILPLSALAARRLPIASVLKMALAWIAIFAVLIGIVSNFERVTPAFRSIGDTLGLSDQSVSGQTVRIRMAQDGHFYADVAINGVRRRMLVDSGATTTAISSGTAEAAGLTHDGFDAILDTANGTVTAKRAIVAALDVGGIHAADLPVVVSPAFGDNDVIGMNFLSRLKAWRVEGSTLLLEPRAPQS